jgi:UDP-N-acetylmuramyl pentapeptide synthase
MTIERLYEHYKKQPDICTDTRKIKPGCIFFALKGANFDGNSFALKALESGASLAVVDDPTLAHIPNTFLVPDALIALQLLATHHRKHCKIPLIAITGSNGKTTTKELLLAVLSKKYKTQATIGNLNNHIGVPLTLLSIQDDTDIAIIEMGANHQQEIASYCKIALPDIGIINNCGKAHLEGFGGIEGVRKGKGELYDYLKSSDGLIFRNNDLDYLSNMSAGINHIITYANFAQADYVGKIIDSQSPFVSVAVLHQGKEIIIRSHSSDTCIHIMCAVA